MVAKKYKPSTIKKANRHQTQFISNVKNVISDLNYMLFKIEKKII